MKINAYAATHVGMRRTRNEDSHCLLDTAFGVFDGMGGLSQGDVASQAAAAAAQDYLSQGKSPEEALQAAHAAVCEKTAWAGTTGSVLLFKNGQAHTAHVGDSRLYRLREGALEHLTTDHNVYWSAKLPRDRCNDCQTPALANCLGPANRSDPVVECETHDVRAGDVFLLFTDGLNTMLKDEDILSLAQDIECESLPSRLVEAANKAGGYDNITVIAVQVQSL